VRPVDKVVLVSLESFVPGKQIQCVPSHTDGSSDTILLDHTFNMQQIDWSKAGSALNRMKEVTANPSLIIKHEAYLSKLKLVILTEMNS